MTWFDGTPGSMATYRPEIPEPPDFDAFWADTLAAARATPMILRRERYDARLEAFDVEDVTFPGFDGQPIRGWVIAPRRQAGGLRPALVQYVGYGGGRGLPYDWLLWPAAGFVTLVMDTRGQGSVWSPGDTPDQSDDVDPHHPGFLTRGVADPARFYYRRLYTDAVRAVDAIREHPGVDGSRVIVAGGSQGGGMALAVASLVPDVQAALIDVPFLCDIERAITITDELPYAELARFLSVHRDRVDTVLATVRYVDGVHFARRATVPAIFAVGMTDRITPPSTGFAAFNHYSGPKELRVMPYSGHDAGELQHRAAQLAFLDGLRLLGS